MYICFQKAKSRYQNIKQEVHGLHCSHEQQMPLVVVVVI